MGIFKINSRLLASNWESGMLLKSSLAGKAKSFECSAQNPCCPYLCPLALAAAHAKNVSISIFHLVGERHKDNLHNLSKWCAIFSKGLSICNISQPYYIHYIFSRPSGMNYSVKK